MELKDKLLELRKEHGMTQDEMAEALLVSRQTIYKWETGKVQPDVNRLRQICLLFNISADELLEIQISTSSKATESPSDGAQTDSGNATSAKHCLKRRTWVIMIVTALLICGAVVFFLVRQPKEIRQAIALDIVPSELESGLSQPVTERELLELLSNVCEQETDSVCPALAEAVANATNEQMTREKAAYWLYCTHIWTKFDVSADLSIGTYAQSDPIAVRNVYEDLNASSRSRIDSSDVPLEKSLCRELAETDELFQSYDGTTEMDEAINAILYGPYYTSVTFCLAQRSFENDKPLMEVVNGTFRPKDKITREEAILAAYRLYGSW